ncbi:MAG: DUF934 domain-containing protein [Pseudohongiellaceae bacterium]
MPKLINTTRVIDNPWHLVARDETVDACLNAKSPQVLAPLALWTEHRQALRDSDKEIAVWLDSDETPEALEADLDSLPMIALNFPVFKDGRPYSTAVTLRQRYGFRGELRAIGDVLRDQLFYMKRCGFDSFDLSDGVDAEQALSAFGDFHTTYAASVEEPLPLFRRRA